MAEPRKPRVIRTRIPADAQAPVATSPDARDGATGDGAARDTASKTSAEPNSVGPKDSSSASDEMQVSGTVRGTSEKVAMLPVPADEPESSGTKDAVKSFLRVPRPRARATSRPPESPKTGSVSGGSAKADAAKLGAAKAGSGKPGSAKTGPGTASSTKPAAGKSASSKSVPAAGTSAKSDSGGDTEAQVLAFPMPSFKRRRRTFLLSAACVIAVLALVMGIALFSPVLGVKTVVFEGNKLVSEDTLGLALAPVISRPLPQVTAEDVSALLEPVVQIKSSRIEARPPSTLVVHVVERVPVALLKNGETYSLVDQDGVELGTTKDAAAAALPLIDGGKAAIGKDTFQAMTSVLATLPKSILNQLANATAKSPDAVELRLIDGRSVVWGNDSDMELKATVLESLLNAPTPTAQPGKPAPVPAQVFDVSAPRHPVTR